MYGLFARKQLSSPYQAVLTQQYQQYQQLCDQIIASLEKQYEYYIYYGKNRKAKKILKEINKTKEDCNRY